MAVLGRAGFAGLTVDAVAAEAGVGKATIYRRWASKEGLVLDAVREATAPVTVPDTGTLKGDLVAFLDVVLGHLGAADARRIIPGLAAAAADDPALRAELAAFAGERRAHVAAAVRRAVARGEVSEAVDVDVVVELLVGPVIYRVAVLGDAPLAGEVAAMVDHLVAGIGPVIGRPRPRHFR